MPTLNDATTSCGNAGRGWPLAPERRWSRVVAQFIGS